MENWGLVTYPKEHMIYDPNMDTDERRLNVTEIVAHELSHQWYGNLATHKWWSQLWLTEGITTYFSMIAINKVKKLVIFHELM